jgi:hypothetical protein
MRSSTFPFLGLVPFFFAGDCFGSKVSCSMEEMASFAEPLFLLLLFMVKGII